MSVRLTFDQEYQIDSEWHAKPAPIMTPLFSTQSSQSSMDWSLSSDDDTSTSSESSKESETKASDAGFTGVRQTPHIFPQTQTGYTQAGGAKFGDTGALFGTLTQYNSSNSVVIKASAQTQTDSSGFRIPALSDARSKGVFLNCKPHLTAKRSSWQGSTSYTSRHGILQRAHPKALRKES